MKADSGVVLDWMLLERLEELGGRHAGCRRVCVVRKRVHITHHLALHRKHLGHEGRLDR